MIINYTQGKVLLLKSKKLNKFHLPGGHLNKGESFSQGLKREVKEETNLTLASYKVFFSKPNFMLYIGRAYPNQIKLSDEHDGYVWAKIDFVNTYPLCNYTIRDMWELKRYWTKLNKKIKERKENLENI